MTRNLSILWRPIHRTGRVGGEDGPPAEGRAGPEGSGGPEGRVGPEVVGVVATEVVVVAVVVVAAEVVGAAVGAVMVAVCAGLEAGSSREPGRTGRCAAPPSRAERWMVRM